MSLIGEVLRFDPRPEADEIVTAELHRIRHGVLNVLQHVVPTQPIPETETPRIPLPVVHEQVAAAQPIGPDSHEFALADIVLAKSIEPAVDKGANTSAETFSTHVDAARKMVERAGPISIKGVKNDD